MFPKLDFNDALNKFIDSYVSDSKVLYEELANQGFVTNPTGDCEQFVLSILYKMEPVYNSPDVDKEIHQSILELWDKLVKRYNYLKKI